MASRAQQHGVSKFKIFLFCLCLKYRNIRHPAKMHILPFITINAQIGQDLSSISTLCIPRSFHIKSCIDIILIFISQTLTIFTIMCYLQYQIITLNTELLSHVQEIQFHRLIIRRHHIQVMSSNLAPGFDQRLIMVILTTLDKGDFASLASTNSLNQHCLQDRLNTYSLHAQQANPLAEFSYTFVNNWYISF